MKFNYRPREAMEKESCYLRKVKKEFYESQIHKVPNELRSRIFGINVRNYGDYYSDEDMENSIK